jgi:hypothetical protein
MTFDRCALTGYEFREGELKPIVGTTLEYETKFVGKVKITIVAYDELLKGEFERFLLAGICKNRTLQNEEPILIDSNFIREGYKKYLSLKNFDDKCTHFLKYLYENGGSDNKDFEFYSTRAFPITYSDPDEFTRIIDQLYSDSSITIGKVHSMGRDQSQKSYMGLKITSLGKNKVKKVLPKIPLFGLINQTIKTGNTDVDEKINHARELFFDEPQTLDKMRSACESLSFVLEPLREELKSYFIQKDVSDFFQIVNNFDIRHNKEATKNLIHPEQLEWVFYSLLNTINTYTKLKQEGN